MPVISQCQQFPMELPGGRQIGVNRQNKCNWVRPALARVRHPEVRSKVGQADCLPDRVAIITPIKCPWVYLPFARTRNSLPGLKCGTYLAGTLPGLPDFGLRPIRGGL